MTFLTWRAIYNRLPTDEKLAKLGINIILGCHCCAASNENNNLETVNHIFCQGEHARRVWCEITCTLGVRLTHSSLKILILNWWNTVTKNPIANFIIQALPSIICWEIWKARCSNKFDAINPSVYKTKANILFTIVQITKKKFGKANIVESWRNIHYILDTEIHYRTTTIVKWIKPPNMSVKLNNDGSCIQDRCDGDDQKLIGNLLFAYYINLGPGTSNIAEMAALLYGLKWCVNRGFSKIWIETDSMLLTRCIERDWDERLVIQFKMPEN
ncbi:hypothetical protein R3W88_022639 [Solanum pinnatisectum]|uniref:RNase H type-1 domain-containing protein n=1 Tax=Solanum pinnatisectum TaxID=50273 RepID=A0AAV9LVB6_9SOLN|nr:hypothetical protein R3W88_022639 [Solanum pinnatisectum]